MPSSPGTSRHPFALRPDAHATRKSASVHPSCVHVSAAVNITVSAGFGSTLGTFARV